MLPCLFTVRITWSSALTCGVPVATGRFTSSSCCNIGAVIIKIISNTNITSTSGVTLISASVLRDLPLVPMAITSSPSLSASEACGSPHGESGPHLLSTPQTAAQGPRQNCPSPPPYDANDGQKDCRLPPQESLLPAQLPWQSTHLQCPGLQLPGKPRSPAQWRGRTA